MSKFKVGDRVVIESYIYNIGTQFCGSADPRDSRIGRAGAVFQVADYDGDVIVDLDEGYHNTVDPEGLLLESELDKLAEERTPTHRIIGNEGNDGLGFFHYFPIGSLVHKTEGGKYVGWNAKGRWIAQFVDDADVEVYVWPVAVEASKTRLYLAGPMRGLPAFNFPAFEEGAADLRAEGYEVFSPAERDATVGFDPTGMDGNEDLSACGFSLREALGADLAYVTEHAHGVALLPGWENSSGVAAEVATARALGLPTLPVSTWLDVAASEGLPLQGWELELLVCDPHDLLPVNEPPPEDWERELVDAIATNPLIQAGEVRTVSATGGEKGRKPAELASVDPLALLTLAEVSGFGARKYAAFNYLKGYDWSLSVDALTRHLLAFWSGEDYDEESGLPHMGHAAWHALALVSFLQRGLGTDNRFKQAEVEVE